MVLSSGAFVKSDVTILSIECMRLHAFTLAHEVSQVIVGTHHEAKF